MRMTKLMFCVIRLVSGSTFRSLQNLCVGELRLNVERATASDMASLALECKAANLQKITLRTTPKLVHELEVIGFYDLDVVKRVTEMAINLVGILLTF